MNIGLKKIHEDDQVVHYKFDITIAGKPYIKNEKKRFEIEEKKGELIFNKRSGNLKILKSKTDSYFFEYKRPLNSISIQLKKMHEQSHYPDILGIVTS